MKGHPKKHFQLQAIRTLPTNFAVTLCVCQEAEPWPTINIDALDSPFAHLFGGKSEKGLQELRREEHHEKLVNVELHEAEEKSPKFQPLPRRNFCQVCRTDYKDHYEHIARQAHHNLIRESRGNSLISVQIQQEVVKKSEFAQSIEISQIEMIQELMRERVARMKALVAGCKTGKPK